jgi:hypothetical protein
MNRYIVFEVSEETEGKVCFLQIPRFNSSKEKEHKL